MTHDRTGCAFPIQLSQHVARIYLSDPTFDTHLDAKAACAKAAILEGVLDFIKHGNGQTIHRPLSMNFVHFTITSSDYLGHYKLRTRLAPYEMPWPGPGPSPNSGPGPGV